MAYFFQAWQLGDTSIPSHYLKSNRTTEKDTTRLDVVKVLLLKRPNQCMALHGLHSSIRKMRGTVDLRPCQRLLTSSAKGQSLPVALLLFSTWARRVGTKGWTNSCGLPLDVNSLELSFSLRDMDP